MKCQCWVVGLFSLCWAGAGCAAGNAVWVGSSGVMMTLMPWCVLSFPAWLCAGSPTLVTSGTCWWESPRTWSWTHAQLLGDLSTHTSWWTVVRSWSFCTRWGEWWGHFQAECWSSSYLPEYCSDIVVLGASWVRLSYWCYALEAALEKISCLLQNHLVHLLQSWGLNTDLARVQILPI